MTTPSDGERAINLAELERAVTGAEPSALLVPPRLLRRVILRDRGEWFSGLGEPRQTSYVITGRALAAIVEDGEIPRPKDAPWPSTVILIERPDPDELLGAPAEQVLLDAWRRLFRARVRAAVRSAIGGGAIDVPSRVRTIGLTEFEEVRLVLRGEGLIALDDPDATAYAEFAALYLERAYFAPALLVHAFPAIEERDPVADLLAEDADGHALFLATRPAGAPDPHALIPAEPEVDVESDLDDPGNATAETAVINPNPSLNARAERHAAKARRDSERGNAVGSAVHWACACRLLGPTVGEPARNEAMAELETLAVRLREALLPRADKAEDWAAALAPLLRRAAKGFWSTEARFLYDLQAVCLDHERELYRLDLPGWLLSLGKKPIKHPLPHLREVAMSNHLRRAVKRLPKIKIGREDRIRLEALLRPAAHQAEEALRDKFRPAIESTLDAEWVRPENLPERVARKKLVEELLDQIVHHGYLTLGDLRDAASRGNLKLPDLTGPAEFFRGGKLLATDKKLGEELDGVHHRGEVYLRWLQRFSALASGTRSGRFFSLFVAIPFGGAFVILEGVNHLLIAGSELKAWLGGVKLPHGVVGHAWDPEIANRWTVLLFGAIALGVINFVRFRREVLGVLRSLGRWLRAVFFDLPAWVVFNPTLRRALGSRPAELAWRFGVKPGVPAAVATLAANKLGAGRGVATVTALAAYLVSALLINTRYGRWLEGEVAETLVRFWKALASNVIPGLFRLVVEAFERFVERIERLMYMVDEWLRFREGHSTLSLGTKAVLGMFWFGVAYLARIYVNLLIEPQINPIKHFPVVTVSHKIILPLSVKLTEHFSVYLSPYLGKWMAGAVVGVNVLLLPGVFGFLVWELKENWRLYRANRRPNLGPVVVGGHGETVVRLLRPGLHSGTLPKLFAKLRRSEPKARKGVKEKSALKQRDALHHVEESVRRFVERDFVELLHETNALGDARVTVGHFKLAGNRIRVELIAPDRPSLWLDLEERRGTLVAGIHQPGWLDTLDHAQRVTLDEAIAGLFTMSGVALVQAPGSPVPEPPIGPAPGRVVLSEVEIPWDRWVATWEAESSGAALADEWPSVLPAPGFKGATAR